jgi:hypothetical protein
MEPKGSCTCVRFEVFTAVTLKNGVFWDVIPCGSCKKLATPYKILQEPHGVTSQKTPFFMFLSLFRAEPIQSITPQFYL